MRFAHRTDVGRIEVFTSMAMRRSLRTALGVGSAGLLAASLFGPAAPAGAATGVPGQSPEGWAPSSRATVHPGALTATQGAGACTSNLLFTDAARNVYLGQAAHCSSTGKATQTNGCQARSQPLGTPVTVGAGGTRGQLAYNSWIAMQQRSETDRDACAYNDFALIKLPDPAREKANPSIPVFGGPAGLNTAGTKAGERVLSYGNSPTRQGIALLSPKYGTSLGDVGHGWSHTVYTLTPGIPGDSGSAFLDADGRALGTLSTLALAPQPLSNQVSDLAKQLDYARAHSGIDGLRLVPGTEPFTG